MASVPSSPFDVRRNAHEAFQRWRPYLGYRATQVRDFAQRYFDKHGIEPTYEQICEGLGIGTRGEVSRIVASLERRGEIEKRRRPGRPWKTQAA